MLSKACRNNGSSSRDLRLGKPLIFQGDKFWLPHQISFLVDRIVSLQIYRTDCQGNCSFSSYTYKERVWKRKLSKHQNLSPGIVVFHSFSVSKCFQDRIGLKNIVGFCIWKSFQIFQKGILLTSKTCCSTVLPSVPDRPPMKARCLQLQRDVDLAPQKQLLCIVPSCACHTSVEVSGMDWLLLKYSRYTSNDFMVNCQFSFVLKPFYVSEW